MRVLKCCECVCCRYVSLGYKVRSRTVGCIAMGSAVFILRSRLLSYSAESGVNRVHVI